MNYFTKEELKKLMNGVWCSHKIHEIPINKELYHKIKSLIDNYCEHEPSELRLSLVKK